MYTRALDKVNAINLANVNVHHNVHNKTQTTFLPTTNRKSFIYRIGAGKVASSKKGDSVNCVNRQNHFNDKNCYNLLAYSMSSSIYFSERDVVLRFPITNEYVNDQLTLVNFHKDVVYSLMKYLSHNIHVFV